MKNKYVIDGDIVKIFLNRKKDNLELETIIDFEDFDKVNSLDGSWYCSYDPIVGNYYVRISKYTASKNKNKFQMVYLHRIIMNAFDKNIDIDHINNDTLDNRKSNLRLSEHSNNNKNRKKKNINNVSGYRNVSWISGKKVWRVQLQINGKNKSLGDFPEEQLEKAGKFADEMRKLYYKDFEGKS